MIIVMEATCQWKTIREAMCFRITLEHERMTRIAIFAIRQSMSGLHHPPSRRKRRKICTVRTLPLSRRRGADGSVGGSRSFLACKVRVRKSCTYAASYDTCNDLVSGYRLSNHLGRAKCRRLETFKPLKQAGGGEARRVEVWLLL